MASGVRLASIAWIVLAIVALAGSAAGSRVQAPTGAPRQIDVAARRLDAERLMRSVRVLASRDFEGRQTGTPGALKARAWLVDRFNDSGLAPAGQDYLLPFTVAGRRREADAANVAALCPGTSGTDRVIVVSAHYDHLGVRNGQLHPGADDNASGVALLVELARLCSQAAFRHTLLFVAFDAEEQGLGGARAFLASPPVARNRIALNVNLDMVARGDKGELYAAGTGLYPQLRPLLAEVAARAPVKLLFGHDEPGTGRDDWTHQSDQGPFHAAGIPFVYFGVEDHPDYHQPTDTADKIDPVFFGRAAETILDALSALDGASL